MARAKTTTAEQIVADDEEALKAALRPFADLPISPSMPDDAHPAFQIMVGLVREARRFFPDTYDAKGRVIADTPAPEAASEPAEGETEGQTDEGATTEAEAPSDDDDAGDTPS